MDRIQLKNNAKQQIKGNIGIFFVITLIVTIVSYLASLILSLVPGAGTVAIFIIASAFELSHAIIALNLYNGRKLAVSDTFSGFKDFWSAFKVMLLATIFTFLWSLLFIIPGIIKGISYSQAMYILAENPGMSAMQAIEKSKRMMHGHKMDYFVLGLSFIGWIILSTFTMGILYIWLTPYMVATYVNFYKSVSGDTTSTSQIPADFFEGEQN